MPATPASRAAATRSRTPKKPRAKTRAPRPTSAGDTAAELSAAGIREHVLAGARSESLTLQAMTLTNLLAGHAAGDPAGQPIEDIRALLAGASPDEVKSLRRLLFDKAPPVADGRDPDTELAPGWRNGGYPYLNLLSRRSYEEQKYRLQVELLKLQAWVKESGQRVVILFEGRDAAGKGGDHQALHGAPQSPGRPRCGAGKTERG